MRKQSHLTEAKRKQFGAFLRRMRVANRIPLREAAKSIGHISFGGLAAIERGEPYKITMPFLMGVSDAYGIDYDSLCFRAERVPHDIYYKLVKNIRLWERVRDME